MKKILLSILVVSHCLFASDAMKAAQQDATKMAQAFVKGDYAIFIDYVYPTLRKMMGDKEKAVERMKTEIGKMKAQGASITAVTVSAPKEIFDAGNEQHTLLEQRQEIKMKQGKLKITSYLIGISGDKGKTWKFLDTSKANAENIKTFLPNYNPKMVIPQNLKPEFTANK